MKHRVSIVTPVFGTPLPYLAACAASVTQTFDLTQASLLDSWTIAIDGDERDIEAYVLSAFKSLTEHVRFIRLPDRSGLGAARNAGVNASAGGFLAWLDADDLLIPEAFTRFAESAMDLLSDRDALLAISDNIDCHRDLSPIFTRRKAWFASLHAKYRNTLKDPLLFVDFVYQCQLIRRGDFEAVGGFAHQLGEDVELVLRLYEATPDRTLRHVPEVAYLYRTNPFGIVRTRTGELREQNRSDYGRAQRSFWPGARTAKLPTFREFALAAGDGSHRHLRPRNALLDSDFWNVFLPEEIPLPEELGRGEAAAWT